MQSLMSPKAKIVESLTIPLKQKFYENIDHLIFQYKIELFSLFPGFIQE